MNKYSEIDIWDLFYKAKFASHAEVYQRFSKDEFTNLSDDAKQYILMCMDLYADIFSTELHRAMQGIYNIKD